ncbi:hypothetical protein HID58_006451 [Brassica napus]|uniref:Secreted protein n=1 Tax=Brassica napus TaxID=3708 RepID=A0ABQ8EBF6_BRANA|nr:hypothetical protein HID58_006451 [Brassica napus]
MDLVDRLVWFAPALTFVAAATTSVTNMPGAVSKTLKPCPMLTRSVPTLAPLVKLLPPRKYQHLRRSVTPKGSIQRV